MEISSQIQIKSLEQISQPEWLFLWKGYQTFYEAQISEEISENTWAKLTSAGQDNMYGFAALIDEKVVGLVHVVEHDSSWTMRPYAYLQDLFVHPDYRGQGVARALIQHVYDVAKQRNCDRVYWLTQESNHKARLLYDKVAKKTGFVQYRMS
ncbi:GNAT family N-acetyltransferase [Acinetobacter sp. YH12236]|uniref:GNAT family N-acetyltransferase n=1 Tax=Acinetobacter sp. YH12236 TaxID=2601163 RepID=UPI0015D42CF5|nr:GNAT family N-acetyltransferase [Acinetobacter sp. YH12236]